ncbi:MAG: tetratricopeptide repeat protein [Hyphomicrobiaceae bacterium]|jgi:hypothetical protein
MAQSKQQFSPDQILEAGRRAETQGQGEYAIQFFRHLVEFYPSSNEAAVAREALQRLAPRNGEVAPSVARNGTPQRTPMDSKPAEGAMRDPLRPPVGPVRSQTPQQPPQPQPSQAPRPHEPRASYAASTRERGELQLPGAVNGYLLGRSIAVLVLGLGVLLIVAGIAIIAMGTILGTVPLIPPVAPPAALGGALAALGVVLAFIGQFTLATFATANATRETAAVLRAIAEELAHRR